jgi:hypothetical protein
LIEITPKDKWLAWTAKQILDEEDVVRYVYRIYIDLINHCFPRVGRPKIELKERIFIPDKKKYVTDFLGMLDWETFTVIFKRSFIDEEIIYRMKHFVREYFGKWSYFTEVDRVETALTFLIRLSLHEFYHVVQYERGERDLEEFEEQEAEKFEEEMSSKFFDNYRDWVDWCAAVPKVERKKEIKYWLELH